MSEVRRVFRSFVYLDTDRLNVYKKVLERKQSPKLKEVIRKKETSLVLDVGDLELSGKKGTEVKGEFEHNEEVEYDNFEKTLEALDGTEYFDCVLNDYDVSTISAMNIARLIGRIAVPESFDAVTLIELFKPFLLNMAGKQIEEDKVESIKNILNSANADIPIIVENNDITIVSKLKSNFLREHIETLEDYAEQEVFLLCKVIGRMNRETVEIFDPFKDFIRLPRQTRKALAKDLAKTNLNKTYIDGPVLKVEVVAIYK